MLNKIEYFRAVLKGMRRFEEKDIDALCDLALAGLRAGEKKPKASKEFNEWVEGWRRATRNWTGTKLPQPPKEGE